MLGSPSYPVEHGAHSLVELRKEPSAQSETGAMPAIKHAWGQQGMEWEAEGGHQAKRQSRQIDGFVDKAWCIALLAPGAGLHAVACQ